MHRKRSFDSLQEIKTTTSASHVTDVGSQSALSLVSVLRAPAAQRRLTVGGLESTSVDDVGDVFGRVGPQSPVCEPLAQLCDAQLALGRQRRSLGTVDVRVIAVFVEPYSEDRHRTSRQRPRTTSRAAHRNNIRIPTVPLTSV